MTPINYPGVIADFLHQTSAIRTLELTNYISQQTKRTVQSGPFAGMVLPEQVSWGNGDVLPKLLGTYEQELHPAIEKAIARNPKVVFNVGCAEGYYAVGLARRLSSVPVYAFDTDKMAREICFGACLSNNTTRAITKELFTTGYLDRRKNPLIIMDIEGGECNILTSPPSVFDSSDLIVECHDFIHPDTTDTLVMRFKETHDIEVITEGPRDPSSIELVKNMHSLDRWLCVNEGRPVCMQWLVAWSKER